MLNGRLVCVEFYCLFLTFLIFLLLYPNNYTFWWLLALIRVAITVNAVEFRTQYFAGIRSLNSWHHITRQSLSPSSDLSRCSCPTRQGTELGLNPCKPTSRPWFLFTGSPCCRYCNGYAIVTVVRVKCNIIKYNIMQGVITCH